MNHLTNFEQKLLELAGFSFEEDPNREDVFTWRRYCNGRFVEECGRYHESIDASKLSAYEVMVDAINNDIGLRISDWDSAGEESKNSWVLETYPNRSDSATVPKIRL